MADYNKNNTCYTNVGCDVVNCKYHGNDDHCHAQKIIVESHNALRKAETYCGTFEPKSTVI